jgi:hypothetical protein
MKIRRIIHFGRENLKEKDHLADLGVNVRIKLE